MVTPSPATFIHPSNALTYTSLMLGIAAIAAAMSGSAGAAGALLAAAAIADTFDGRWARRFSRNADLTAMGAQLDSLVDAVSFGIAPVVIAALVLEPAGTAAQGIWWSAAFVYVACALTRLGFYNVRDGDGQGFVGLPTPVAALCWATLLLLDADAPALILLALASSAAMIAPLRIRRPGHVGLVVFVLWPITLIVMQVFVL